jgi:hypothetical protein
MTEPTDQTGAPPGLSIPPDALKTVARFSLRLLVAYAFLVAIIQIMTPLIELLIARGARNLLGMVSSAYYLKTIEFIDGGYAFSTWIGPLRGSFRLPTLLFTFGFPIGYAISLPGFTTGRYWLRLIAVILTSYFVCAISVAVVSDARLTSTFLQFGITLQPEWRIEVSRFAQYYLWMFTVRLYPLLMVVLLALVSGQFRGRTTSSSRRVNRLVGWSAGIVLALLSTACVGFDSTANERIQAVAAESITNRLDGLEELNPDIGPGLVELAEYLVKQENDRAAMNAYRLALTKLEGGPARRAQFQLRVVHERIKSEMLEAARRRREGEDPEDATTTPGP